MLRYPLISLVVYVAFFVMAGALYGWGKILGIICRIPHSEETEKEENILMGLPCLYLLAGFWNFFLPVNLWFDLLFILPGLIIILRDIKNKKYKIDYFFILIPLFFIPSFFIYRYSWDFDMYHADTVRWINAYAVVPGLGNLHSRLGFNQFYFYLVAVFRVLMPEYCWSIVNLFFGWITISFFWNARKLPSRTSLSIAVVGCIIAHYLSHACSVPQPDCASFLLQLILLCSFVWQFKERTPEKFSFFLFLSATAVMTKFSNAMICMIILPILFLREQDKRKVLLCSLPFAVLLGSAWCIRSVLLTGYMFYPIAWPNFNVEWKLPLSAVKEEQAAITGIARGGAGMGDYHFLAYANLNEWVPSWVRGSSGYASCQYLKLMLAEVCILFLTTKDVLKIQKWIGFVPAFTGLVFWFFTAPDPRFAAGILYFIVLLPLSILLEKYQFSYKQTYLLIMAIVFFACSYPDVRTWTTGLHSRFQSRIWRRYEFRYTDSGLRISYAENSHTGKGPFDGMAPLPVTPYFNTDLTLRGKDFQDGFVIRKKNIKYHQKIQERK